MRTTGIILTVLGGVSVLGVAGVVVNTDPGDRRAVFRAMGAAAWPILLVGTGIVLILAAPKGPPKGPPQGQIGYCPRCRGEVLRTLTSCPHCGFQPGLSKTSGGAPPPTG